MIPAALAGPPPARIRAPSSRTKPTKDSKPAKLGGRIHWIADADPSGAIKEVGDELVRNRLFDQNACARETRLTIDCQDCEQCAVKRAIENRVGEADGSRLAAQLVRRTCAVSVFEFFAIDRSLLKRLILGTA